MPIWQS